MKERTISKPLTALLCAMLITLSLAGCAKSLKQEIIGSWFVEGKSAPVFTFYENGTVSGGGDTATWAIVNDNQLQITGKNYFGGTETIIFDVTIKGGCLTLASGGNSRQLWNTPR